MFQRYCCVFLLVPLALPVWCKAAEPRTDLLGDPLPPSAIARLGTIRLRHGYEVERLMFSPDGKRLASCGGETWVTQGISIWELATGKEKRRVRQPGTWLDSWGWSPDDRGIAVLESSNRRFLCDFNAATIELQAFPEKDNAECARFAVAPAGNVLVITQADRNVPGYAVEFRELTPNKTARELKSLRVGKSTVGFTTILSFTPDGRTLIAFTPSGEAGWIAVLWDVATATERRRLSLPLGAFRMSGGETVVASNERLAVGMLDGSVRLYDLGTGEERQLPARHKAGKPDSGPGGVTAIAFYQDGSTLVTAGSDRAIRQWDVSDGKLRREFPWTKGSIKVMAVSPDGKKLAIGGSGGVVWLLDASTGTEVLPQPGHQGGVLAVAVSADGRTAATTGADETIRIWDLAGAREVRRIAPGGRVSNCVLAPDGKTLMAGVHSGDGPPVGPLRVWNVTDGQEVRQPELSGAMAQFAHLAADGRTLVTLRDDKVSIRNWPSGALQSEFKLPQPQSQGFTAVGRILAMSPDGKQLVTLASHVLFHQNRLVDAEGGTVNLWETTTGKHVRQLAPTGYFSERAAFTATGELLLANAGGIPGAAEDPESSSQGEVHVLNLRTGRALRRFALPRFPLVDGQPYVTVLAVSFDGRTAYVGGRDGTVYACEVATGGVRQRLAGHRDRVTDLAIVAGGRRLVTTSGDATALIWDVSLPAVPAPTDLDAAWNDLSAGDASKGFSALATLAAAPERSIRFLAERLPPAGAEPSDATLDRLIADLDNDKFAVRENAEAELGKLAELAVDAIRARLSNAKTLESQVRMKRLLEKYDSAPISPERLREIRALELLEYLGGSEARDVLASLAKGKSTARRTQEAIAILQRVHRN